MSSFFDCYNFVIFKNYSFIHTCIHCLGHFSSLPPLPPLLPASLPGRTCSALITNFVEEKEDKAYLLVELGIAIQKYS
jgi:hypothetical protein